MKDFTFFIESEVNAVKDVLWKHVTQMKNVNAELMPFARMTYPQTMSEIGNEQVPLNRVLFKSVIVLFGFLPLDIHYLRIEKLDYGTAFFENSYSWQHHYWKHTRIISERNGKIFVKDEIHFAPRISFLGNVLLPVYKLIFRNRHKNLKAAFQ